MKGLNVLFTFITFLLIISPEEASQWIFTLSITHKCPPFESELYKTTRSGEEGIQILQKNFVLLIYGFVVYIAIFTASLVPQFHGHKTAQLNWQ